MKQVEISGDRRLAVQHPRAMAAVGLQLGSDTPFLAVCAFPYLLAFTTDAMEIRLVVNGNLVHTAVVPQLQLVASRVSDPGFGGWVSVHGVLGAPGTRRL